MKKSRLFPILFSFFLVIALTFAAAEFQKKVQPVASGGTIKARPGIAYDAQAQKYLVVWQDRTGRSWDDWDIKARMLDSDGNPAGRVMHLASSAGDERHPRAAATGAGSWLVVWSTGRSIEACDVDAEGRIDGFRSVTANAGRPVDHPDVGFSSLDGRFFVVWEELDESGLNVIKGRSVGGAGEEAREAVVLGRSAYDNLQAPSINQTGGKFFVAWEKAAAAGRIDIEGREVPAGAASADALGSVVAVAADGARNTAPSVTGVPGTSGYVVVWQAQRGTRSSEIAFADVGGDKVLLAGDLTATESRFESRPAAFAAGLAGRILVTYQAAGLDAPAARDIAARTVGWGDTAASAEIVLDEERSGGGNPAIVRAAGADGRGIIVWDVREGEGTDLFSRGWQEAATAAVVAANGPIIPLADITISGQVTLGGLGQADVLIGGLPSTVRTDALGFYTAMVPSGWTGTVIPAEPGYTFSPAGRTYTNQAVDATAQDYVAAFAGGVDDAYEENDTFETAASLALGTTRDLVLNDEEWFKFYVPAEDAGKDLKVRVWGTGFPDATTRRDLDFGILDASGRLLSYSLSGAPDETAYVCGVAEGWYYVVQNYIGAVGTVYSLSAEVSDAFGLVYVSGQVLDDEEESPVAGATVELYGVPFDWNVTRPLVCTDANGFYKIGWVPGDFTLRFNTQDFGDDGLAWTPDANYLGDVYQYNHVLTLTSGASLENVNMYLIPGGTITGQITDGSGAPLGAASAQVYLGNWSRVAAVLTDSSGVYRVDRLRAANYAVRARTGSGDLINEWFDDKSFFASADPVGAAAAATTSGIDASLDVKTWGTITGRVLDADMNPVGNLQVSIVDPVGLTLWAVWTDGDGYYTHSAVPAGDWKVLFNAASVGTNSLVSQYYPGTRFLADATTVHVVAGAVTEGIDAVLPAAGSISGRILNNNGSVAVIAFDTASNFQWSVSPAVPLVGETTYVLDNLPPGTYKVLARPSQQGDRIPHWYPDATSYAAAGTVTVAAGATTENVDVMLPGGGGMIIGRVVNAYGYAIPSVRVIAQDASKESPYSSAISDGDGYFTIRQVPPGLVKVYFNADANWLGYVSEYYNDKTSFAAADAITVNESESTPLSDAALAVRPSLAIATTSLPGGEIGVAYSQQLGVEGGWPLYRWTLYSGALPPGLAMSARGAISGTPTTAGTFSFMVTVTDSSSGQMSATRELSITIGEYTGSGYMISGTVLSGETPLAGVTMSGLPGNPATNAAGGYIAAVPSGWSGTVTPVRSGNSFTPATRTYANVTADAAGQDYTAAAGYRITGTVTRDGAGLAGVTMAGLPGAPATDSAGAYAAAVPAGWSGTVTPTLPGFTFSPADRAYDAIAADATAQDYTAAFAGGVDDAFEENDSFETAAVLPMGKTSGLILRDEDWFKFYVSAADAGKDIRVVLNGTAYPDPTIRQDMDFAILDADKRLLGYNTSGCDDETAYIYGAAEGWYYISNAYYEAPGVVYALTIDANSDFGLAYVTGTLTDDGGNPIAGAYVELYGSPFDWNISRPLVMTGEDGTYRIGYTPGFYTVQFNVTDFNDEFDWTPDLNFLGEAYHGGEVLTLVAGETLADIDGRLTPGGVISGRITDASGNPIGNAAAFAYAGDAVQAAADVCDAAGHFELERLRAGNYAVRFRAPGGYALATEWHADGGNFADGLPVAVVAGATTGGIDAALGTAGSIAGRITDEEGNPIESVQVTAYDPAGMALQSASTDADGNYSLGRLPTGTFKIRFNAATVASANYVSEYYPDVLGLNEGQEIAVTAGNSTGGIDGVLAEAGAISGTITDSGGQACVSANVYAFSPDGSFSLSATTDAAGAYAIRNLPPGDYRVRFRPSTENMTVEWYNDRADFTAADVVTVAAGAAVSGLDAAFSSETGLITGRVTNGSGDPVEGLMVVAQDAAIPAACYSVLTDASGAYTLRRLPTGSYKVWFNPDAAYLNYLSEYYDDKGGHGSADAVEVTVGNTTSGIDAVLAERPGLAVTTESLAAGQLAVAYSGALAGSGGRPFYYWSLESGALPDGLAMNSRGEISGVPTMTGAFTFVVRLTDSTSPQQAVTQELSITIGAYTGEGFTVSGTVTAGGVPLAGVTLEGFEPPAVTDSAGRYVAVVVRSFWGTVTPSLAGYAFDPPLREYFIVNSNLTGHDYTASAGHVLSGRVTLNGTGQGGVLMAGLPAALRTDESGGYSMMLPDGWSGTVTPTLPGFAFSPAYLDYAGITADTTAQNYVATYAGGADDAYEDNDTFETAAAVTLGTNTADLILNDLDWFKVLVPAEDAGKVLAVRIRAISFPNGTAHADPTKSMDLDFGIMDAAGTLLTYNMSGDIDEVAFIPDIKPGWYYIAHNYLANLGAVYELYTGTSDNFPVATISGRVTDEADQGVDGVTVALYGVPFDWNVCWPMAITDADGNYKIAAVPGNYQVKVNLHDFHQSPIDALPDGWLPVRNFLSNSYDYDRTVTLDAATPITGADVVLPSAGAVSGQVTDGEGNPLVQARVFAYLAGASQASYAFTDADGNYLIRRLRSANYALLFRPPVGSMLAGEWYDGQGTFAAGLPVAVTAGATTTGIDAVLDGGGRISGLVTNESGDPVPGVTVVASEASSVAMKSAITQADGSYLLASLPAGTYSLLFNTSDCQAGNYMMRGYGSDESVAVTEGQTTEGIDVILEPAGSISGRLTDGDNRGLVSGSVSAVRDETGRVWTASPDFEGNYLIRALSPGSYRIRFTFASHYPPEWYPAADSGAGAALITVTAGETVSGIDGVLEADGSGFSGRVTDASGTGIPGLTVVAVDGSNGEFNTSSAVTDGDGNYTVLNVPLGTAKVLFQPGAFPYAAEFYNDKSSFEVADALPIVSGSIQPGVDAVLAERPALAVTTESLAAGELGVAYSGALAGSGGRPFYYWSIESGALPDGLAMNGRGEISGVPAMAGAFTFVARVTDSTSPQQAATRELSITIGEYTGLGHTISGLVTFGGLPLAGVTMNGLPGTPMTTSGGSYVAVVADGWSGTVTPSLTGYAFSPATRTYDNVTASASGQDFAAYVTRTISGAVTLNSAGLAGVLMSGLPGDPVTGGGGSYSATVPDGWSGTATPTLAGYAFTPATRTYTAVTADVTAQDYTAAAAVTKEDFLATWDGQGVYYKNSDTGGWVKLASPATMIAAGDLDGDGIDDIIGLWPGQGGIWVKYSQSGSWAKLSSTAVHIAAGDMNGDGREDLLGTWDGQGVFYRNSIGGAWVKLASPATLITTGDLDGDGTDDLVGIWPSQGGVWVKYSHTGAWAKLSSTARDICVGDANGDGRDDLIATWDGQGVFYRNSISGAWVKMASVATQVACGDLDGDGKADLIGIWPTQGGVWVKYSKTGAWALLSSTAVDISAGKMRAQGGSSASAASPELAAPAEGRAEGPETAARILDLSGDGPGGPNFRPEERGNLTPGKGRVPGGRNGKPGPGERGFKFTSQANLWPGSGNDVNPRKEPKKIDKSLKNKG